MKGLGVGPLTPELTKGRETAQPRLYTGWHWRHINVLIKRDRGEEAGIQESIEVERIVHMQRISADMCRCERDQMMDGSLPTCPDFRPCLIQRGGVFG